MTSKGWNVTAMGAWTKETGRATSAILVARDDNEDYNSQLKMVSL
jgi:hypothetical protein